MVFLYMAPKMKEPAPAGARERWGQDCLRSGIHEATHEAEPPMPRKDPTHHQIDQFTDKVA